MKVKPTQVVLALGIATSVACVGGSGSSGADEKKIMIRMVNLSSNAALLYRLDSDNVESLLIPPVETSTISPYVDASLTSQLYRYLSYRVKVDGETVVQSSHSAEEGSWRTLAVVQPYPGMTFARVFPVDLTIPRGLSWNFSVAHMATGYAGSIDVYIIRGGQTLATAERLFTNISQYTASPYELNHVGGEQIAICPTGTRESYVTVPFPDTRTAPDRRFTVFFRGTSSTEGGFGALVAGD